MKDPAFLFYPGDVLKDITFLSETQRGIYLMLMCAQFETMCIPNEKLVVCLCNASEKDKEIICLLLASNEDGSFYIPWMHRSQQERALFLKSRSTNGAKGGRPKTTSLASEKLPEDEDIVFKEIRKGVVDFLNLKNDCGYKYEAKKTTQAIHARFMEGVTLEDFKMVISDRVAAWGKDVKMSQYLRPETLFGPKFESYLQNARKQVSADPPTKYNILRGKGWLNCSEDELRWAFEHQHRTETSYADYPETELLVKAGLAVTRSEVQR